MRSTVAWLFEIDADIAQTSRSGGPSREAEAQARRLHRLPYSRSAFEDVAHLVGRQVREHRSDIEHVLLESLVIPDDARSVSASMDRVSIPMEEAPARPVGKSS